MDGHWSGTQDSHLAHGAHVKDVGVALGASLPVMAHGWLPACTGSRGAGMSRTRLAGLASVIRTADAFDFFAVLGLTY